MVVSEQPVVKPIAASDFFQEVRQLVWLEISIDFLLNRCRCAVCDDVVDFPVQPIQRLPGFRIFFIGRQFFLPPRNMVDAELSTIAA